jgi:hypothetical protein
MTSPKSPRSTRKFIASFAGNHALQFVLLFAAMFGSRAASAATPTATTLSISSNSVPYRTPIVLTATVTAAGSPVTTGFVLFCDASAPQCETNSPLLGMVPLTTANGTAVVKVGSGPQGIHSYKAVYRANNTYASSASNTVSYTVQGTYASNTALAKSGSIGNYTLAANVTGIGSIVVGPSGTVSFVDESAGKNVLGTQTLGAPVLSNAFAQAPNSPFPIGDNGVAPPLSLKPYRTVAIASAYLNGDNNLDVVTGDSDQIITVLLGNGDGTFQPKVNYPGCQVGRAMKILLSDFNRDGNEDIALGCSQRFDGGVNGGVTIILGNGDGSFQTPTYYSTGDIAGLAVGDFNGDGLLDLVVTDFSQQDIKLMLGNGNGSFQAPSPVASVPRSINDIVAADFDGDGKDDIAYAMRSSSSSSNPYSDLYIALGNGDGTFQTAKLRASQIGEFLTKGDTNGDNIVDIVSSTVNLDNIANPTHISDSMFVLIGKGDGTFKSTVTYVSDIPSDPHLTDVNGDGKPDIIAGGSYGALVYGGNGDGTFQAYGEAPIGNFTLTYAVNAGDYDNDGNSDLIGTDANGPRAAVALSEVSQVAGATALTGVAVFPLGSGIHNVDATYSGDSIFKPSVSSTVQLQAAPVATSLSLAVSPASSILSGQPLILTATLNPFNVSGPPSTTTDGQTVTFYNGASSIGTGTLNNGVATLTTSTLPAGTDSLKAVYPGDVNYKSSTSSVVSVTVSVVMLNSSPNPSAYGQTVTMTVTVPAGSTGNVTIYDGVTKLSGTMPLNGAATVFFSTSTLAVGSHPLTAVYSGDATHAPATSPVVIQVVNKITPTMSVTTSGQSTYQSPVTITATLPTDATGTVAFTSGATVLGTAPVTNGSASIITTILPVGDADPITAIYSGDNNYNTATASTTRAVTKLSPSSTLTSSANPSAFGANVTFTDTLPTTVTGTVTFTAGASTVLGTSNVVNGVATISTSTLNVGNTTITATYNGDGNNNTSVASLVQAVNKSTPTMTLASSANPSLFNQSVTFTATLPSGATGNVSFSSGATSLGTGTIANGVATITTSSLPVGSNPISAQYSGDSNNDTASANLTQVVNKATPTVTVTTSGPSIWGNPVNITATVPSGVTGTIAFTSGAQSLGSGNISGGTVTITTSSLPVGNDTITATYGGDTNNNSATGTVIQIVSKASPASTLTSSLNPSTVGASVTFTDTLPTNVTGTVTFANGAATLGTSTVNNGVATFTTSSLPGGSDVITATYNGDGNNNTSTATLTQTIDKNTPTMTVSTSGPSIFGNPVTITAQLPAGVTGSVTFTSGATSLGASPVNASGVATIATTVLPIGTDTITANYGGDSNNNTATATTTQVVSKGSITMALGSSVNPAQTDQPVTFTATLSSTSATGTVTFTNGATVLGTSNVTNGVATVTTSTLPVGANNITAAYSGDTNNEAATASLTETIISKPTANVALVSSLNPSPYGQAVTFTATIPSAATGTITFYDGAVALGISPVVGGAAALTTSTLTTGSHVITASYSGDSTYGTATSAALNQVVNKLTPVLPPPVVSAPTITSGSPETITEAVPSGVSGPVTFYNDGTPIGTAPIIGGVATITVTNLPVGSDPITASTPGDANNNPATSPATTVTVTKPSSTVTLASSLNPSSYGQAVVFTATLSSSSATGTVTFTDGATPLGTAPVTNGQAAITTSSLATGTHTITASYAGDTNYGAATSNPLTQIVNKGTPTLPPPSVSNPTEQYGGTETITETVPPGVSGPVTFYDGGTPIGTAPVVNGTATITVPDLPVGSHPITASTPGDTNNNPATSPATTITVTKTTPVLPPPNVSNANPGPNTPVTITENVPPGVTGPVTFSNGGTVLGTAPVVNGVATITVPSLPIGSNPITASVAETATTNAATSPATIVTVAVGTSTVTLISSANPAAFNQAITFTASVPSTATGTITFRDGSTVLGTGAISGGTATLTTSSLTIGTHPITAAYGGDTAYSSSTSAPLAQVVGKLPTTTVLTQSAGSQLMNGAVTFTATVSSTAPTPTGTVTFLDGTTVLGTVALNTNGGVVVGFQLTGTAALTINTLSGGSHTITAVYSGDNTFLSSTSTPLNNIVHDFTNTNTGAAQQEIFPGEKTTFKFTLTPTGTTTFIQDVKLTVSGLPEGTTYTFSPDSVTSGAGSTGVTLNVTTSNKLQALGSDPRRSGSQGTTIALGILGLAGLGTARRYRRRMPRILFTLLLLAGSLLPVAALTGCAGGYFTLKPTTYTVTVTGTEGTIQHSATATLVVQ